MALQHQLIRGGHLGTSLVELDFIDEVSLGKALADIHDVPWAPREMFEDIPKAILDTVPVELVKKRRVIPVGIQDRVLHLAVIDPRNLANLSTTTGYKIQPYIAPEIRIVDAMERYYCIRRPARYVRVSGARPSRKPVKTDRPDALIPPRTRIVRCKETEATIRELSRRLGRVEHHAELAEIIVSFASGQMQRCILFEVDKGDARPVTWKGDDLDGQRLSRTTLPISTDSIFSLALDERCFRGSLPGEFGSNDFFRTLGIDTPGECLILPIYGDESLEAILYGDGGVDGRVDGTTDVYLDLLERVDLCLGMLRYKRRLLAG
jgi:hypothetical protein